MEIIFRNVRAISTTGDLTVVALRIMIIVSVIMIMVMGSVAVVIM